MKLVLALGLSFASALSYGVTRDELVCVITECLDCSTASKSAITHSGTVPLEQPKQPADQPYRWMKIASKLNPGVEFMVSGKKVADKNGELPKFDTDRLLHINVTGPEDRFSVGIRVLNDGAGLGNVETDKRVAREQALVVAGDVNTENRHANSFSVSCSVQ